MPQPQEGECLVRVHLAGICSTDLQILDGYMAFQGILGHEMVGSVVEGPTAWRGKRVACEINCVCGTCAACLGGLSNHCARRTVMGIVKRDGCFADFVAVPTANLHEIPDMVSDEDAVFVEPLAAAYQVPAQCRITPKMRVSVIGPGKLGILVAQVLATMGCQINVIGTNHNKLLHCEKKGIQGIHVDQLSRHKDRDVVVECSGSPEGMKLAMALVRPRGTIVLKSTCAAGGTLNLAPIVIDEITLLGSRCGPFPEAIAALARGAVEVRSMISKVFPIKQAPAAFEAAASRDRLKVLLDMSAR
ncbi:MAG: alcohol dehydrogenase catalytic domain-containing protein [Phycisphaerae bacterium]